MCEVPSIGLPTSQVGRAAPPTTSNRRRLDAVHACPPHHSAISTPPPSGASSETRERRRPQAGAPRALAMVGASAAAFLAAALALAAARRARARAAHPPLALAFVAALALAARIEFSVGAGTAVPTQLVFVPMLLLLPDAVRAAAGGGALASARLGRAARGRRAGRACSSASPTRGSRSPPRSVHRRVRRADAGLGAPARSTSLALRRAARWSTPLIYVARVGSRSACRRARLRAELGLAERVDAAAHADRAARRARRRRRSPPARCSCSPLFPLLARLRARARGRGSSAASSSAAPTAAPRCCCATCSRTTTSTPATTPRTSSRSRCRSPSEMGVDEDALRATEMGALLHDIGKIARPRRDHQQARPARRRRVGDHEDPHGRGPADAPAGRRRCSRASAWSCARRTSAGTAAATPTGWPARRSRSPRASSPPATPSTR